VKTAFPHYLGWSLIQQLVYCRTSRDEGVRLRVASAEPAGYPKIIESPSLKAVEKGRGTAMICGATGNPEPVISWLKDSVPVDMTDQRLEIRPTGAFFYTMALVPFSRQTLAF